MAMPPRLLLLIIFVCSKVEDETIRLNALLITNFMAFGTKLFVEHVKVGVVLHHF
jgi:hypothetical protein